MDITSTLLFAANLEALGVALPAETANARAIHQAAGEAALTSPADDLRAAMVRGDITPDNVGQYVRDAALAQNARETVHSLARDLALPIKNAMLKGLKDEADRIRDDLAAVFNPAAAEVVEAAKYFGPSVTGDEAIAAGPKAVKLYQNHQSNTATLTAVSRAYQALLNGITGDLTTVGPIVGLYIESPADLEQAAQLFEKADRWMQLATAGFKLTLNSAENTRRASSEYFAGIAAEEEARRVIRTSSYRFGSVGR